MVDLKLIVASNIIKLRTDAKMTQSELGEKLNYSDKSVSKWERAESLPDANVLKQLSEIFGVTVDFLLNTHNEWVPETEEKEEEHTKCNFKAITWITIIGIWTFALFLFILFWMIMDKMYWIVFLIALPIAILTQLVLNSVWNNGKYNRVLIASLCLSLIMFFYFVFFKYNIWQLFLLMIPVILILYMTTKIVKKH